MDRPNVLLVLIDQLRRDGLGCYGDPVTQTPAMDWLAVHGARFVNCVSTHPVCSPYRATLQTGQYAHRHGVTVNNLPIDTALPSLADSFNAAGYHTAYFGKAHWWDSGKPGFYPERARLRYQQWWGYNRGHYHWDAPDFDEDGRLTHRYAGQWAPAVMTDRALELLTGEHDRPWFCQLNLGPPHNATMDAEYADPENRARMARVNHARGFGIPDEIMDEMAADDPRVVTWFPQHLAGRLVPEQYLEPYEEERFEDRPDVPEELRALNRACRREYSAMTQAVDDQVARLLKALHERGGLEKTLVIVTSDHGDHLGAHGVPRGKSSPYQAAWRVPLLIAGPGVEASRVATDLVSTVDLTPTICDLAGVAPPPATPGLSLAESARGAAVGQPEVLVGLADWRTLVTDRWAYTARLAAGAKPAEAPRELRPQMLIDHGADPYDLENRLQAEPTEATELHARLLAKLRAVGDPILEAGG